MSAFLERTICCKVKTVNSYSVFVRLFLERTICCKVKTKDNESCKNL